MCPDHTSTVGRAILPADPLSSGSSRLERRLRRRFTAPQATGSTFLVPWELEELLRQTGFTVVEQWGDYGRSLSGETNPLELAVRDAPIRVQQAAATTWGFVAT